MKILLLFPNYLQNFFLISASFYPPLGLAMIAGALKKAGHEVVVIDATASRMNIPVLLKRIDDVNPDIIGITANIAFARKALLTGRLIKKHFGNIPIIFGGPWSTVRYDWLLKDNACDFVVIGEGETKIVELVRFLEGGGDASKVRGIAFKEGGTIVKTPDQEYCNNLDGLPFPAWELFPGHSHYFWNPKGKRYYPVMTSRGCPYGCINCTKLIHGYRMRYRSVGNVMDEIRYLHENFKADEIIFIDDGFNHDINRAEEICDEIMKLDFKVHLRFTNGLRADKITPRLAYKLKQAGAYDIVLGIESGNQEVVNRLGKNLDLKKVRSAVKILKRLGIITSGFFMVGIPHETVHTMIDTKNLIKELALDRALISRTIPFPGTRLYDIVIKSGSISPDFERQMIFYSHKAPAYDIPGMPSELIELAFQDYYRTSYFSLKKMLGYLKTIRLKNFKIHLNFAVTTLVNLFKQDKHGNPREMKKIILEKLRKIK
ncbi:MAG: B12-binding domain-containing radical SAM protein [Promethearchaeota archaeon]